MPSGSASTFTSGSYKGTVESFGFRSVKLRHHRGPLFTVPFGVLGAVQNMSRDWVIDKMTIGVTYDSDFDKAKKLIKQIGKELAEDPELAPNIIEPLKMQGVEQFGDYGDPDPPEDDDASPASSSSSAAGPLP